MQKRMIELNQPCADPTLAASAQLRYHGFTLDLSMGFSDLIERICNLLEQWIHDYPNDFAVRATTAALNAIIKRPVYLIWVCNNIFNLETVKVARLRDSNSTYFA